jgi:hypothetical protein
MGRICWKMVASIGLIVFSQTASAALNSRGVMAAGDSAYRDVTRPDDPKNDARLIAGGLRDGSRTRLDLDKASIGPFAQAGEPAASAVTPVPGSKAPGDQSPPAISSTPNPKSTTLVTTAAPTAMGCGLKYLTAEIAGKLKGRKWKEFREEECGGTSTQAVFPSMIAPKYSGESTDKARTLTCADQFNANKATNANDGMKWIEKGGGYYSECVSRLKG